MNEEYYEERECDHDDDVMCTHTFFDYTTKQYLARRRLKRLIDAGTHWIIGVTPQYVGHALGLEALHQQRCGEAMISMIIHDLHIHPLLCTLPKDQVALDEIIKAIGGIDTSREVIESKRWILLTSLNLDSSMQAIDHWITVDPLSN